MTSTEPIELIRFLCPHCGKQMRAPLKKAGRKGPCARCGQRIEIPSQSDSNQASHAQDVAGDDLIDGFSLPPPPQPVDTLEALKTLAESRDSTKVRPRRTPIWMWALHLSLPLATAWFLLWHFGYVKSPRELLQRTDKKPAVVEPADHAS